MDMNFEQQLAEFYENFKEPPSEPDSMDEVVEDLHRIANSLEQLVDIVARWKL